jgi:hypothetical protein
MTASKAIHLVTFRFGIRGEDSGHEDFLVRTATPNVIAEARNELRLPRSVAVTCPARLSGLGRQNLAAWHWMHRASVAVRGLGH